MTPEQIAADRIAQALYERRPADGEIRWPTDWHDKLTDAHREAYRADGRDVVESISAAGLVIVEAARLSALLDLVRAARALAGSEEQMKEALAGRDTSRLFDPWPEADALVAALRTLGAGR